MVVGLQVGLRGLSPTYAIDATYIAKHLDVVAHDHHLGVATCMEQQRFIAMQFVDSNSSIRKTRCV